MQKMSAQEGQCVNVVVVDTAKLVSFSINSLKQVSEAIFILFRWWQEGIKKIGYKYYVLGFRMHDEALT